VLDLNQCNQECTKCILNYKKKHRLKQGEENPFRVSCKGIPEEYIDKEFYHILPEEEVKTALSMLDPVTWAAEVLDWHCFDPDGEVWKRKNPEEYYKWVKEHPDEDILGKSRYHRPYQGIMLRCSSKRKVFRIGRQAGKSEAVVIAILFNLFTKPGVPDNEGFRVIILTPYQAQIDLLFNRMDELLSYSSMATNSIKSRTKSPPCKLILHNNSICTGFTAGTKSGGNADSVRGQKANMLVFDEADYLNPGDLDSALSIITNYPDAVVWMSSTPKGTRDTFYNTCFSRTYKEFHFPSYVNPLWNDELENTLKEQLTEIAYKHEALAIFGEQEEGVFQNTYIQAAKSPYRYGEYQYDPSWVYIIGVDWNDVKIGTNIVVVGFEQASRHAYIVDRRVVSRDGWTQLAAMEKIAEMNQFWQPAFIYVDTGYGATNQEVLRKYGYDSLNNPNKGPNHPDSRLKDIVKGYNFGGKVEIHDLITKQPISKPSKPFLVENTVRWFETGTIHFPESDDKLEKQLLSYIVDHVTSTGSPVYKTSDPKIGDHALDGLMLALVGYTLEKTLFGQPHYSIDFTFSGKFGEKIMPDLKGAGIIIENRKKEDLRAKNRPSLNRAEELTPDETLTVTKNSLPGAHLNHGGEVKLWAWPGFERDAPRPKLRSMSERKGTSRSVKTSKPTRKNI
jgi:replicative DNA helicase